LVDGNVGAGDDLESVVSDELGITSRRELRNADPEGNVAG
jgi:hypothetical protein